MLVLILLGIQHVVDGSLRKFYPEPQFSLDDIPDQIGKHALITGATSGIGKAMAIELARRGAHVFVGARDEAKAQDTVAEIIGETGASAAMVEPLIIDLGSLASVKAAADLVNTRECVTMDAIFHDATSSASSLLVINVHLDVNLNDYTVLCARAHLHGWPM
jgi:NAD(P)-dependent dehydrogenase (short-subunit alcohol dehydrogenase family)